MHVTMNHVKIVPRSVVSIRSNFPVYLFLRVSSTLLSQMNSPSTDLPVAMQEFQGVVTIAQKIYLNTKYFIWCGMFCVGSVAMI